MATPLDAEVTRLARRIAALGTDDGARVYRMSWWSDRMLGWAMNHPSFKTQLFRFVDVFPATTDDADVLRHLREYFEDTDAPRLLDVGMELADHVPGGGAVSASVARRNITRMAHQFIVGTTPAEAVEGLHRLWRQGDRVHRRHPRGEDRHRGRGRPLRSEGRRSAVDTARRHRRVGT